MVSKAQFEKIALSFEGAEKGMSYGKPSFLLFKKFFTRLRDIRSFSNVQSLRDQLQADVEAAKRQFASRNLRKA